MLFNSYKWDRPVPSLLIPSVSMPPAAAPPHYVYQGSKPQLWLVLQLGEGQERMGKKRIRGREEGMERAGERENRNSILCIDKRTAFRLKPHAS